MSHWIVIEAEHPETYEHVVVGPFETAEAAATHLDSVQVDGFCEDDAIDCHTVTSDAARDKVTAVWTQAGDYWGVYKPIPDSSVEA